MLRHIGQTMPSLQTQLQHEPSQGTQNPWRTNTQTHTNWGPIAMRQNQGKHIYIYNKYLDIYICRIALRTHRYINPSDSTQKGWDLLPRMPSAKSLPIDAGQTIHQPTSIDCYRWITQSKHNESPLEYWLPTINQRIKPYKPMKGITLTSEIKGIPFQWKTIDQPRSSYKNQIHTNEYLHISRPLLMHAKSQAPTDAPDLHISIYTYIYIDILISSIKSHSYKCNRPCMPLKTSQ